ncbi:hypothetical protein V1511DRAFT_493187 [Dipodascopsis uninucleata]
MLTLIPAPQLLIAFILLLPTMLLICYDFVVYVYRISSLGIQNFGYSKFDRADAEISAEIITQAAHAVSQESSEIERIDASSSTSSSISITKTVQARKKSSVLMTRSKSDSSSVDNDSDAGKKSMSRIDASLDIMLMYRKLVRKTQGSRRGATQYEARSSSIDTSANNQPRLLVR